MAQASPGIAGAVPFAEIRLLYLLSTAGILLLQGAVGYAGKKGRSSCRKACKAAEPAACAVGCSPLPAKKNRESACPRQALSFYFEKVLAARKAKGGPPERAP